MTSDASAIMESLRDIRSSIKDVSEKVDRNDERANASRSKMWDEVNATKNQIGLLSFKVEGMSETGRKIEGMDDSIKALGGRMGAVERAVEREVAEFKKTSDEYRELVTKAKGAGWLGRTSLRIGAFVVGGASVAYSAYTFLKGWFTILK